MNATLTLRFEIELLSAYHISSGSGKGTEIDSALLRDADGVPVIRGTTLSGLLRDAMRRLLDYGPLQSYQQCRISGKTDGADYCGHINHDSQNEGCPLCAIFGTPKSPKHWHISSARPQNIARSSLECAGEAAQRVRINPRTRRAEQGKLFCQENGDPRLHFYFEVNSAGESEVLLDEAAFLLAAARYVRELGRSRRRGQGECRISLKDALLVEKKLEKEEASEKENDSKKRTTKNLGTAFLLKRFEERGLAEEAQMTFRASSPSFEDVFSAPATHKGPYAKQLWLLIRADEPLQFTRRGEAGNQFQSLDFVSGTNLWGAFAERVLKNSGAGQAFAEFFQYGRARFSPLYPFVSSGASTGVPSFPVPLDTCSCKIFPGAQAPAHGFSSLTQERVERCPICEKEKNRETPLTRVAGFLSLKEKTELIETPSHCYEMHNQIDTKSQRVDPGQLYGYTPLTNGQYFLGELSFPDETAWQDFRELADLPEIGTDEAFELRIGKAARRGHGKISAVLKSPDNAPPLWIGKAFEERVSAAAPQTLVLTLLSDTILQDRWGRFNLSLDAEALNALLPFNALKEGDLSVFTAFKPVDGFHGAIGLPRRRDFVLKAGSSVGITLHEALTPKQLACLEKLEQEGIGLRRREGFGRIVFNHPFYSKMKGVDNTNLTIPEELRSGLHQLGDRQKFLKQWNTTLDGKRKTWEACSAPEFESVARRLYAQAGRPLTEIQADLRNFGKPKENLSATINDYGERRKERNDKLDKGLAQLGKLLEKLQEKDASYHQPGVEMLAERLAAAIERRTE